LLFHRLIQDDAKEQQADEAMNVELGDRVEHPRYGGGQIVALYRNGEEWMVRFDSGLRFRRDRHEFSGEEQTVAVGPAPLPLPDTSPMTRTQYEARNLVEALRVGVAPAQHVSELTIGLAEERASLIAGLNEAHSLGGAARAVLGDYGYGKSHIVELTSQEALERNFLVATTSLDLGELPPHRAFDIFGSLMRSLRYPKTDVHGIGPLVDAFTPTERAQLNELGDVPNDPLVVALQALDGLSSTRQKLAWQQWLMGGRRLKLMNRALPRKIRFPSIYRVGHNARQIAYLLSGVSVMARLVGYSGLCVLIDEAESYSLLYPYQRPKAGAFFSAVIYAAMQDRQSRITDDAFPQHRWRDYPLAYNDRQSLFFLFTVTRSDDQMPLESWLSDDQILTLDPHHSAQEIGQFLQQLMGYHAQAYNYGSGERQGQLRRGAAEHLALGVRNGRLNTRAMVRLAVELYDLLYLYPNYPIVDLLDELRSQMQ
jgi:hypothetical protein